MVPQMRICLNPLQVDVLSRAIQICAGISFLVSLGEFGELRVNLLCSGRWDAGLSIEDTVSTASSTSILDSARHYTASLPICFSSPACLVYFDCKVFTCVTLCGHLAPSPWSWSRCPGATEMQIGLDPCPQGALLLSFGFVQHPFLTAPKHPPGMRSLEASLL